ncbi:MAG: biosynthetic peptidoglycan transglycosylase [Microthrixaceae bacterium]
MALPVNAQPSAIYDANGTLITVLAEENRQNVAFEQIPRSLQDAVVAIEDARFWTHNGVDPRAILRAAGRNAEAGSVAEGGSTITQQYVKIALLTPEQTLGRKMEEATTALALERNYSKQLIPRALSEHDLLRQRRLRRRCRRRGVLRCRGAGPDTRTVGAARRDHPGAVASRPTHQSRGRAASGATW